MPLRFEKDDKEGRAFVAAAMGITIEELEARVEAAQHVAAITGSEVSIGGFSLLRKNQSN